MLIQMQQRRGTAAQWTSSNPVLASGEFGYESDTGKLKVGDGSTSWASLAYYTGGAVDTSTNQSIGGIKTFTGTVNLPTATTKVGNTSLIQGGTVNITLPTLAGTLIGTGDSGTIATAMLANSSSTSTGVTYAKMQYVSAQYRVHGRITAAAGVVEELTPDNLVTVLGQATVTTARQGTGANVLATSPIITTPTIVGINASAAGDTATLWNTTLTTGSISIGGAVTTGTLNLLSGAAFNGTINIGTGAGTVNKTINIGTASTAGTTTIAIGSSAGATNAITLNGPTTITQLITGASGVTTPITGTTYTATANDTNLVFNGTATCTVTLPTATAGKIMFMKTIAAFTVVSASSNVLPRTSGTAGTAILSAAAGSWAMLVGNGTNWVIMAGA